MLAKTKEKDVIDQMLDQIDFHGTILPSSLIIPKTYAEQFIPLAIKNASTRWTMSLKDWGLAVNKFAILFDGRVPVFN